jgi:hypothetical protein
MAHEEAHSTGTAEEVHHTHVEVIPNPEYDGPTEHCLPPAVKDGIGNGIYFVILLILVVAGAIWLGRHLLVG